MNNKILVYLFYYILYLFSLQIVFYQI